MWRDPKQQRSNKLKPVKLPPPTERTVQRVPSPVSPVRECAPLNNSHRQQLNRWEASSPALVPRAHTSSPQPLPRKNRPFEGGCEETSEELALENVQSNKYLSREVPKWVQTAKSNLKREHKVAKHEQWIIDGMKTRKREERSPMLDEEVVALPASGLQVFSFLGAPFICVGILFVAGFAPAAVFVIGAASSLSLFAAMSAPVICTTTPPMSTDADEFNESGYPQDASPFGLASSVPLIIGIAGSAQLICNIVVSPSATHANLVADGLVFLCIALHVGIGFSWIVRQLSRSSTAFEPFKDMIRRTTSWYRAARKGLVLGAEARARPLVETLACCCDSSASTSTSDDDVLPTSSLEVTQRSSDAAHMFNALGEKARHSPLLLLLAMMDMAIAIDEILSGSTVIAVAYVLASIACAVAMTDGVRAVTDSADYVSTQRDEFGRRKQSLARWNAQVALHRILETPFEEMEPAVLLPAIQVAVGSRVDSRLIERAREVLRRLEHMEEQRKREAREKQEERAKRRESVQDRITAQAQRPPLDVDTTSLEAALEEAREASVPPDFIAQGEAVLKLAVGKQAARQRGIDLLRPFLDRDAGERVHIDATALDLAIEEAKKVGASHQTLEAARELLSQVQHAQEHLATSVASDVTTIKSKPVLSKWQAGCGEDRFQEALDRGIESVQKLMLDRNADGLTESIDGLSGALADAHAAGVEDGTTRRAQRTLEELRGMASALDSAYTVVESAIDAHEMVTSNSHLLVAEKMLVEALSVANKAYVATEQIATLEQRIRRVREQLREAAAADAKLLQTINFCSDHLDRFNSKRKSQLQIIAIPSLKSAIAHAQTVFAMTARIREAEEKLSEAHGAQMRSEEAGQWLVQSSKAALQALIDEGRKEDGQSVQGAIDSLSIAIKGALDGSVDTEDIKSAEQLLSTLKTSQRQMTVPLQRSNSSAASAPSPLP